jgi:hypothetical protein
VWGGVEGTVAGDRQRVGGAQCMPRVDEVMLLWCLGVDWSEYEGLTTPCRLLLAAICYHCRLQSQTVTQEMTAQVYMCAW